MGALPLRRIRIHADNIGAYSVKAVDEQPQRRLNTLRARTELLQVGASAFRAPCWRRLAMVAIMAHQQCARLVVRQRRGAIRAFGHIAAITAQQEFRKTALVQQQNGLLMAAQRAFKRLRQLP